MQFSLSGTHFSAVLQHLHRVHACQARCRMACLASGGCQVRRSLPVMWQHEVAWHHPWHWQLQWMGPLKGGSDRGTDSGLSPSLHVGDRRRLAWAMTEPRCPQIHGSSFGARLCSTRTRFKQKHTGLGVGVLGHAQWVVHWTWDFTPGHRLQVPRHLHPPHHGRWHLPVARPARCCLLQQTQRPNPG